MLLGYIVCYDRFFTEQNNKAHQSALQMGIFLHTASIFYSSIIANIHARGRTPTVALTSPGTAVQQEKGTAHLSVLGFI